MPAAKSTRRRVGLRDVAREGGVSVPTVSRILRGDVDEFRQATVDRVCEAARALNYRPDANARNLAAGCTKLAGIMVSTSGYYGRIFEAINQRLFEAGHMTIVTPATADNGSADDPHDAKIVHQLIERRVDGIILRPSFEEYERRYFEEIWQRNIPLILIDRELALFKTDFVGSDDHGIGVAAARLLTELGHKRMLFLGNTRASTSVLRSQGFRDYLLEQPGVTGKCMDVYESGWDAVQAELTSSQHPTGVFCYGDGLAWVAAKRIEAMGLRIPADVSLIGAGNEHVHTSTLTTFDQHQREIGRQAAELYLERVEAAGQDRPAAKNIRVPATLIQRASTAPPPND